MAEKNVSYLLDGVFEKTFLVKTCFFSYQFLEKDLGQRYNKSRHESKHDKEK